MGSEHSCLERMCDLIGGSEDLLVGMVRDSARRDGIRTPRSDEVWLEAVRGLSDAIFQSVYGRLDVVGATPDHDPVVAYGILRGRAQCARGVSPVGWRRLMRRHHDAYLDLVRTSGFFTGDELVVCRRFIDRVFDRMEEGFRRGHREYCGGMSCRVAEQ